jgi:serine/threonine protein kinase
MVSSESPQLLFNPFPLGAILGGRYRIVGILGRGGMGVVYAADDLKLAGNLRAVKVIAPIRGGRGRYAGEAYMMMKVNHPHLPLIMDYYSPEEHDFEALVMEYIDGRTVAELISSRHVALTFSQIIHVGLQLCAALIHLHGHAPPIIHRDLKPTNVMIDHKWHVKLIDFGISRQYKEGQQQDTAQLGTVGFAAPEQEGMGQSDERTDVYGLGALLYYMASGGDIYNQIAGSRGERAPFAHLLPDIPNIFIAVLRRLLQADPNLRFRSMLEVEEALKPFAPSQINDSPDHNLQLNKTNFRASGMMICLLSLAPGAGSTFLAHTLAAFLGQQGTSVSAVEYEQARPEWHAWFSGHTRAKNGNWKESMALDQRYVHYKQEESAVNWFSLRPESNQSFTQDDQRFARMLQHAGSVINLIDLSGKWSEPGALLLLQQARFVFVVGDPAVAKWQTNELRQLVTLGQALQRNGSKMKFIANKDLAFRGRNEWLSLFPERPYAIVPRLPEETLLTLQWNGLWAADDMRLRRRLNQALMPIFKLIYNEINTE